jgi:hypothetical protein
MNLVLRKDMWNQCSAPSDLFVNEEKDDAAGRPISASDVDRKALICLRLTINPG